MQRSPGILIISSCINLYRGGQPFTVLNSAIYLARNGAKLFLITSIPKESKAFYELRSEGIKIIHVSMENKFLSALSFGILSLVKSYKIIKNEDIKICQVHAPSSAIIGTILRVFTHIKLSLFVHGFWREEKIREMAGLPNSLRKIANAILIRTEKFVYDSSDVIVVVNENLRQYLEKFNINYRNKIHQLVRCVVTHRFLPNNIDNEFKLAKIFSNSQYNVLFVGAFDGLRGQEYLIKVSPQVIKQIPSVQFIFVGAGSTLKYCKDLTKKLNVERNIHFLGHRIDVINIMKYATICVGYLSPNLNGIGNVHLEAIDMKIPLIAKNDPLLKKVFGTNITYVDPNEPNNLIENICFLLKNRDSAIQKTEKAYKLLKNPSSWENEMKKMLSIYQKLCMKLYF